MSKKRSFYSCATLPIRVEERRFYRFSVDLTLNSLTISKIDIVTYDLEMNKLIGPSPEKLNRMSKKDKDFLKLSIKEALRGIGVSEENRNALSFSW